MNIQQGAPTSTSTHDPVQRLNDHHADDLLDIAHAFTGHPDAISVTAVSLDDSGIDIVITTPDDLQVIRRVEFDARASGTQRHRAFQRLKQAAERLNRQHPENELTTRP